MRQFAVIHSAMAADRLHTVVALAGIGHEFLTHSSSEKAMRPDVRACSIPATFISPHESHA